ncbi:MAG: protein kinase [Planctomycetota bacterium]|nr:protein kinase [Planctomycetota bacterium]
MAQFNLNAALGIADDEHVIRPATRGAIERFGYRLKPAPGQPTSKLGQGAFATVLYAEHVLNKRPAAIKVCHNEDSDILASFKREAETVEARDFPKRFAAETYLSWYEPGAQPFLILEYIQGKPIDQYVAEHKPSQAKRIELLEKLLYGVQSLHDANTEHRDLSAANVLVDARDEVRFVDFGEAGEITRSTRHTTLRNTGGNAGYSPGEQVRGEKEVGPEDDIFAATMIAAHVLTGKAPPSNAAAYSGDTRHLAACQKQLHDAHVPRSLSRIIVRGLRDPSHRYKLAKKMAEDLFDYRVRRPQRLRATWISITLLAACMLVAAVSWQRYSEAQRDVALAQYNVLNQQAEGLTYRSHPAVDTVLREVDELKEQWNDQLNRGERYAADGTLRRMMQLLERSLALNAGLERSHPRREALGTALQAMRWVEASQLIQDRKRAAEKAYQEITELLGGGQTDEACKRLDNLQQELAQLTKDNSDAVLAFDSQQQYQRLEESVSKRIRELPAFDTVRRSADDGQKAWEVGEWSLVQRDYGHATQRLDELLEEVETPLERAEREKTSVEVLRLIEQEKQQLQGEITRLASERDGQQKLANERQRQISDLNQQWLADRKLLDRAKELLTMERAKTAGQETQLQEAQRLAKQHTATVQQLTKDRAALETQAKTSAEALTKLNVQLADTKTKLQELHIELADKTKRLQEYASSTTPAKAAKPATTRPSVPARTDPPLIPPIDVFDSKKLTEAINEYLNGRKQFEPRRPEDFSPDEWKRIVEELTGHLRDSKQEKK